MNESGNASAAPRVVAYALIGHGDRLLLVEHEDYEALPGGSVRAGEPVEHALRRALVDQLGVTAAALDFCTVIEIGIAEPGEPPTSQLVFLFDVTLTNRDDLATSASHRHRWADEHRLSALRPPAIRDALTAGAVTAEIPWRAWTP